MNRLTTPSVITSKGVPVYSGLPHDPIAERALREEDQHE